MTDRCGIIEGTWLYKQRWQLDMTPLTVTPLRAAGHKPIAHYSQSVITNRNVQSAISRHLSSTPLIVTPLTVTPLTVAGYGYVCGPHGDRWVVQD